ncbi:glycoside hydrolase superfamily [Aspergillus ambiguus]|uniref:putative cell wall glucanase (Scw4) n=1 Tax=Aspergillus ambiguus TaxID=176160 RepID=UPI003CCD61D0
MRWLVHVLAVLLLSFHARALPYDGQLVKKSEQDNPNGILAANDDNFVNINVDQSISANIGPFNEASNPGPDAPAHPHAQQRRFGISYSPYNDDGTCRNQAQVDSDLDKLPHYAFVRIYGVDCDQTKKVVNAAHKRGMRVFAGVFDLQNFPASLDPIIDAAHAHGDWSIFHTISVGNELVNRGHASPAQIVDAVHTARRRLRAAGYHGPVVTVDTFDRLIGHPELCHASDYCAANCHAFFDSTQSADGAGAYVRNQAHRVSAAAGGKRTVITETGWPHQGQANGQAVPSVANQHRALTGVSLAFHERPGDLVMFSSFDDKWKQDGPGTFGAEKFWGIHHR